MTRVELNITPSAICAGGYACLYTISRGGHIAGAKWRRSE